MRSIDITNVAELEQHVLRSDVPTVVYFYAPWWGACGPAGPAVQKAVAAAGGKAALVRVNVDQAQELAEAQGVEYVPAIILFSGGERVSEYEGKTTPKALGEWINANVGNG